MKTSSIAIGLVGIILAATVFVGISYANPSFFMYGEATAAATTTVVYMTPGAATTTIVQRAFVNGNNNSINDATLLVQFAGSSTISVLNIAFEYADLVGNDCYATPTKCDWYRNHLYDSGSGVSTTSTGVLAPSATSYNLTFASTTVGGASGAATRTMAAFTVPVVAPFVRAVISMPPASTNGAVWAQFLPAKEVR